MSTRGNPPRRPSSAANAATSAPRRSALSQRLEPYGGITTITVVLGAIVFLGVIAWQGRPRSVSTDDLRGVEVPIAAASHTTNPAEVIITVGDPPVGGPHFPTPTKAGKYADPVQDGNVIHSLEHGMVWISYNKDRLTPADIKKLEDIQGANSRDVVLSPRPENQTPIGVASWGRLLRLEKVDEKAINDFIRVNRDRSPEPGVR